MLVFGHQGDIERFVVVDQKYNIDININCNKNLDITRWLLSPLLLNLPSLIDWLLLFMLYQKLVSSILKCMKCIG